MKIVLMAVAFVLSPYVCAVDVPIKIRGEIIIPACTGVADPVEFNEVDFYSVTGGNHHWVPRLIMFDCPYGTTIPKVRLSGVQGYDAFSVKTTKFAEGLSVLIEMYRDGSSDVIALNSGYWDVSKYVTRSGVWSALHTRFGLYHDPSKKLEPGPFSAAVNVGMSYD